MTLYKKKPLPKRKVKKGLLGGTIPLALAGAGEAASGAGSLPFAIVVGSIADYNRRKNGDWFLDLIYTSPTGVAWQRPIPSKRVAEVIEDTPAEPVREETHRPVRITPVIDIGVQAPGLDWDYDRYGIERVLDHSMDDVKSFYADENPDSVSTGLRSFEPKKDNGKMREDENDGQNRYQKFWSWTKEQYRKGKDLWDKGKSFNHGPLYRLPLIFNLGYDFRQWDENTPWYKKAWDITSDLTPGVTLLKFIKNFSTSKLFDKVDEAYNLAFDDNTNTNNKSEEGPDTVDVKKPESEDKKTVTVHMSDTIDTKLDNVNLLENDTVKN